MQSPVLVARLLGPLLAAIGLGVLLNAPFYNGALIEAMHSPTLVFISGVGTLLAGLAILNAYRAWTADWRVAVTIVGWLFVLAGIIRVVIPQVAMTVAPKVYSGTPALMITGAIVLVVGGFISYHGYRPAGK